MTLTNDSSPAAVATAIIVECQRRGYGREACIAVDSTARQESGLRMVWDPSKRWFGYFQQDGSYPNRMDPMGNIIGFLDRLDKQLAKPGASPDIWLNIFWLQQGPNIASAQLAYDTGRKAYLTEIKRWVADATADYERVTGGVVPGWTGDPTWIKDVLQEALGSRLRVMDGWDNRGHGDFLDIRGVMMHHTGNALASPESIRDGRDDLAGPLSNIHIAQDGTVTLVAVGVCWHAGVGSYPWLPTNNANWHMIGIECAWPKNTKLTAATQGQEKWPDAQIISMRDTAAALLKKLGFDASRVIGHKDYAGSAQGKWDPGNLDTKWFQGEVQKDLNGFVFPGEGAPVQPDPPTTQEPPDLKLPPLPFDTEREIQEEILRQLRGPYLKGWDQLGGKTVVDSLADAHRKLDAILVALQLEETPEDLT